MSLDSSPRTAYNEDHEAFRQSVRQFLQKEVAPNAKQWQEDGIVPKSIWPKAGEVGMLALQRLLNMAALASTLVTTPLLTKNRLIMGA